MEIAESHSTSAAIATGSHSQRSGDWFRRQSARMHVQILSGPGRRPERRGALTSCGYINVEAPASPFQVIKNAAQNDFASTGDPAILP